MSLITMPAKNTIYSILLLVTLLATTAAFSQNVYTVAGVAGVTGNTNGTGTQATFHNPYGIASDGQGNIYVANRFGNTIRKISLSGQVTTYAGTGNPGATDGSALSATFNEPWSVACDSNGNVYVADAKNYKIRKIDSNGQVTTVAGIGTFGVTNGAAALAQFGFPTGLAVNATGSIIYVSDRMTNTIRKIENGMVSTFAGTVYSPGSNDGQGLSAKFNHPNGLALDATGNLIVADEFNNKIRRITPSGYVSTLAGNGSAGSVNGPASTASFKTPWAVCVAPNGDIFVGDADNFTIRKISSGIVSTYAGQTGVPGMINGPALQSTFNGVSGLCINKSNDQLYLCDEVSHLVRRIAPMVLSMTVNGGSSFCAGSNISIQVGPSGLSNYRIYVNGILAGTSSNGSFSLTAIPVGQHTITATATTASGALAYSDPFSLTITAPLSVSIIVNGSSTICDGDSVTLSSSVLGSYQWSTGAITPTIRVSNAGSYTVTVTNAQGCSGVSAPQQVSTLQSPAASISSISAAPNCPGDTVVLTAGQAPQYLWSNGSTTQSIQVTGPGSYSVQVTNASGCSAMSLPMNVNYHPVSISTISPAGNVVIPQGTQTTLTAGQGTSYVWSTGATSQSILISDSGLYSVTVVDMNGCVSVPATVQVAFLSASNLVSVQGLTQFCKGDSVVLVSAFNSFNQWYKNGSPIAGAIGNVFAAKETGTYKLRYSPLGSSAVFSNEIEVEVLSLPETVEISVLGVCPNTSSILSITPVNDINYGWYDSETGGTLLFNGNVFTTPTLATTTPYYILQTNAFGCVAENRLEVLATVFDAPSAEFTSTPAKTETSGYIVSFQSNNEPGVAYLWDFGDPASMTNLSTAAEPSHVYANTGEYLVTCIATSDQGCRDTTYQQIKVVLPDNIFIPNTFTPDGDGQNDVFRVRGNNILYADMNLYDQWGGLIWAVEKTTDGWQGDSRKGSVLPGTYNYAIKVYLDNGATSYHRGSINLIR